MARERERESETIIRAGRGGGYGSSSVSSVRGTCRAGGRAAEKTNRGFFFVLLLLLPHRNTHTNTRPGAPSYRGGIAAGPGTNPPGGGGVPPWRLCWCRSPSRRQQPGAGPLWWREAGISLFSGAPGLIAPHPQSRRRRPAEAALLSLTGRPRAPGGSRAPAAGGLDADLSNAVPAAVMDGSSRERPDPMSVWVIFCEEHSPRR